MNPQTPAGQGAPKALATQESSAENIQDSGMETLSSDRTAEHSRITKTPNSESNSEPLPSTDQHRGPDTALGINQAGSEVDSLQIYPDRNLQTDSNALYKENPSTAAAPRFSTVTSERHETVRSAPSSDMPLLTPEVSEEEERIPRDLTSEMPSLTLAVQSCSDMLPLASQCAPSEMLLQLGKPPVLMDEPGAASKALNPNWCSNSFQEDCSQSLVCSSGAGEKQSGTDPASPLRLLDQKTNQEGEAGAAAGHRHISSGVLQHSSDTATSLLGCSFANTHTLSRANRSKSPSTSFNPNLLQASQDCVSPLGEAGSTPPPSSNPFADTKPFSSNIWKNFNSQNPAVLIESLQPSLAESDVHDQLPYAMWAESRCQQVKSPEPPDSPERALTWANLESSVVPASGSETTSGLPLEEASESEFGSRGLLRSEGEGSERDSDSGEREDDSSSESIEENISECGESGLEPGEVCLVSA